MNLKRLTRLAVLPVFFLVSCQAYDTEAAIARAQTVIAAFQPSDSTQFRGTISGRIKTQWSSDSDGKVIRIADYGDETSLLLHAPSRLTADNFYVTAEQTNIDLTQYGIILSKLLAPDTNTYVAVTPTADGGLAFSVRNSNMTRRRIYTIKSSFIEITAKFNIDLYYDDSGLLYKESVNNLGSYTNDLAGTLDLVALYEPVSA